MRQIHWIAILALVSTIGATHLYLWKRNLRPSKRVGMWEHLSWDVFPKDEQTTIYVTQRLLATAFVLPMMVAFYYAIFEAYDHFFK